MSLDWSAEKVKDYKTVCWDDEGVLRDETENLIFATMAVDLNGVTEKNIEEWLFRLLFLRRVGYLSYEPSAELLLTHIGLSTNVSTKTRAAWVKRIVKNMELDAVAGARILLRKAVEKSPVRVPVVQPEGEK